MKKKLALLLCATLLLSIMLPLVSASAMIGPQWVYTKNGKSLNLREYPDTSSKILVQIPYGTRLTGCEYYNGTWTKVNYNGNYGYVMTKFLMSKEPPVHPVYPTAKPTAKPAANMFAKMLKVNYYVVVDPTNNASFANMRWAPSENQPVLCIYYPGYQLKVLYTDGTWSQVLDEASGNCGFIKNFLIQPTAVGTTAL